MAVDDLEAAIAVAETELADLAARHAAATERVAALRRERARLEAKPSRTAPSAWPAARKVELFRSLFRGREDVFAVRWENAAKHRAGYAPRCANEWRRGICEKPRVRCGACSNQAFVRPDAAQVLAHLQGRQVLGIYPLLADETCRLLAIDLDGDDWPQDVAALRDAANELGLRLRSSARARAREHTSGSSSPTRCRRRRRACSASCCSRARWPALPPCAWAPTIACSRARTRFRRAASGT
jgi:hypothetical protein